MNFVVLLQEIFVKNAKKLAANKSKFLSSLCYTEMSLMYVRSIKVAHGGNEFT